MRFKPPKFLLGLMPELVWDIPEQRDVFLTFDDGPTPEVTEWILDELARYEAKATFFCLGRNVELYPELYRRIVEEGHSVGNHTYSHLRGWRAKTQEYVEDVDRASCATGSSLFRPPYGRITPAQSKALASRYRIVMWNIISRDYNPSLAPQICLDNVIRHVRTGDIVVFHDSKKAFRNMRYALHGTLEYLQSRGMNSKAIDI